MYYNKTGEMIRDQDLINSDTIIDFDTIPLSQVPLMIPPTAPSNAATTKKSTTTTYCNNIKRNYHFCLSLSLVLSSVL